MSGSHIAKPNGGWVMTSSRLLAGYAGLVGFPLFALAVILGAGRATHPVGTAVIGAARQDSVGAPSPAGSAVFLLLLQIAVVLCASRIGGAVFRRLGQPRVMGEMVAGILLGP